MTPRLLLALSALLCLLAVASAIPLTSRDSLRSSGGRGRVHGALNRRLTREQAMQQSVGDAQPQWLTQTLDHSNLASKETFQQRFYVNTSSYNPSAPRVFLMIGGEGPISPSYIGSHFIVADLAVQYGAVITSLEHRFFGQSVPNGDSSSENLRFLSSAAALEDLVVFRQHLSKIYNLPSNTVWIVFGGSYSGSLAAWARAKYPNLFHGAFATSAPLQAQLEFHQYFDVVARSVGPQCAANLQASTLALEKMLQTDRASLQRMFQLCGPIVTDNDAANFVETLSGPIANIVQYNQDNNAYEMYDIPHLCARLESAPTPLQGLASVWFDAQYFGNVTECTDISYDNMISEMQATSDARSWTYQTCAEFGWFQNAIADGLQPFSTRISLDFYKQQCNDIFKGIAQPFLPKTDYINAFYGGSQLVSTNTVYANGDVDPWHVLGNYQSYPAAALSDTVLIHGTAHCADLYPPRAQDLPELTKARAIQDALLAQWLKTSAHATTTEKSEAPAVKPAPAAAAPAGGRHHAHRVSQA